MNEWFRFVSNYKGLRAQNVLEWPSAQKKSERLAATFFKAAPNSILSPFYYRWLLTVHFQMDDDEPSVFHLNDKWVCVTFENIKYISIRFIRFYSSLSIVNHKTNKNSTMASWDSEKQSIRNGESFESFWKQKKLNKKIQGDSLTKQNCWLFLFMSWSSNRMEISMTKTNSLIESEHETTLEQIHFK